MWLLSVTGPIEHSAVSVWRSGGHPTDRDKVCSGDIDRTSFTEYPQGKQHKQCFCAACFGKFINKMVFGLGLGLCLWSLKLFCPSDTSSKFSNKCLSIPPIPSLPTLYPIPLTQSAVNTQYPTLPSLPTLYPIPLTQSALNTQFSPLPFLHPSLSIPPNTICCQHTIPPLPVLHTLYPITLTQSAVNHNPRNVTYCFSFSFSKYSPQHSIR